MSNVEKYIKDGMVAVAISPGYGAGWSSWEHNRDLKDTMVFHPDIIKMILDDMQSHIDSNWLSILVKNTKMFILVAHTN